MESNKTAVTIIVPTYNVEKYAGSCFESLINQSLNNIEIILVDDGSTDSSGEICEEYAKKDSRIRVIHQSNIGLGLSRNTGISLAHGEYIGFVDSDDCVSEDMFKILYENAKKNDADISYCNYQKFFDLSQIRRDSDVQNVKIWSGEKEVHQYFLDRIGLPPKCKKDNLYGASVCCGIFSRELISKYQVSFVSEREFIAEDMIYDIDIVPHANKIVHSDSSLYYYRYNPNSLTTVYKPNRFSKNVQLYHEMHRRLEAIYKKEELFNSLARYLVTTARIAVMQEAKFLKKNGWKRACDNVNKICCTTELQDILEKYEYCKMPFKYRVICTLQRKKNAGALLIICALKK